MLSSGAESFLSFAESSGVHVTYTSQSDEIVEKLLNNIQYGSNCVLGL